MEKIKIYNSVPIGILPYDHRTPEVFLSIKGLLKEKIPCCEIIHFGSTAINGMPGKGVIDVMILVADETFEKYIKLIEEIGFHYPSFRKAAMPMDKPFRVGAMKFENKEYNIHCHIARKDSDTHRKALAIVEALSNSKKLCDEYLEYKKKAIERVATFPEYNSLKGKFFERFKTSI